MLALSESALCLAVLQSAAYLKQTVSGKCLVAAVHRTLRSSTRGAARLLESRQTGEVKAASKDGVNLNALLGGQGQQSLNATSQWERENAISRSCIKRSVLCAAVGVLSFSEQRLLASSRLNS